MLTLEVSSVLFNVAVIWGVQFMSTDYNNVWTFSAINAIFVIMVIIADMYLILFNAFIVILEEEFSSISACIKQAVENVQFEQLKLLANFHGKTTQLMSLVTKAFSLPILFYVLLTFFEGTLQMFQMYFMLLDVYGRLTPSQIAEDIICYFSWLGPLMVKLVVTMHLATRASEVVSQVIAICNNRY